MKARLFRTAALAGLVLALLGGALWTPRSPVVTLRATSSGLVMPTPIQQFFDDNGAPLSGGKLYAFAAGTEKAQATYSDSALTVPHDHPIILNSAGRATIYLARGTAYKFVLQTSTGGSVWTQDNVSVPSEVVPPSPQALPTGAIVAYGGTSAPTGYLLCQGQPVDRTIYANLFSAIGTAYGVGDGSTTFNLPNLQQRFPLGKATSGTGSTLGGTGGTIDMTLDITHTHGVPRDGWTPELNVSGVSGRLQTGPGSNIQQPLADNTTGASSKSATAAANPPFQVVNFVIKTEPEP